MQTISLHFILIGINSSKTGNNVKNFPFLEATIQGEARPIQLWLHSAIVKRCILYAAVCTWMNWPPCNVTNGKFTAWYKCIIAYYSCCAAVRLYAKQKTIHFSPFVASQTATKNGMPNYDIFQRIAHSTRCHISQYLHCIRTCSTETSFAIIQSITSFGAVWQFV